MSTARLFKTPAIAPQLAKSVRDLLSLVAETDDLQQNLGLDQQTSMPMRGSSR